MRLRTSVLIAGALGVVMLVVGLVAQSNRLEQYAHPSTDVQTSIVVVSPELLAVDSQARFAVESTNGAHAYAARPVDVVAWVGASSVTYVTDIGSWESLTTRTAERVQPPASELTPSPGTPVTPVPSVSPSSLPTPSPTTSPTPSPSPTPGSVDDDIETWDTSSDLWRQQWSGHPRLSILAGDVTPGLSLIYVSADGSPLSSIEMRLERPTRDEWIGPVTLWGLVLTFMGALTLIYLLLVSSPLQAVAERVRDRVAGSAIAAAPVRWMGAVRDRVAHFRDRRHHRRATMVEIVIDETGEQA